MLAHTIISELETVLDEIYGANCAVLRTQPVLGGSINRAYRVGTTVGDHFLKQNGASRYPDMFKYERKGLELLSDNSKFIVPKPLAIFNVAGQQILLMEWLEQGYAGPNSHEQFGQRLAQLHRSTQKEFGLEHDNYIGSLPQGNTPHGTWSEFYWCQRLEPQIRMAKDSGILSHKMAQGFERLRVDISEIFPIEPPALLHGDLWSGNAGYTDNGEPTIFDPAVYYGHREMDIAMMHLFGGFPVRVFQAYNEVFPLHEGWQNRISIGQLYPLMVHVNLFGESYCGQVSSILSSI